ncbi:FecR family protein [Negadavirga shengliensis]|uniref:FecR family protein n=1 Tax=Negadavirga shengliensis TaxID=1389218 RepID=A0ABV9T6F8_9BACT
MGKQQENIFFELISNRDFVDWHDKPNEERTVFWQKWIHNHPQHRKEFLKAQEFLTRLKFRERHMTQDESETLLSNILSEENKQKEKKGERGGLSFWGFKPWARVAAILVISLFSGYVWDALVPGPIPGDIGEPEAIEWITSHNGKGRKSKIILPDGTVAHLNYETVLAFPKAFKGSRREVKLTGEAFFEVMSDKSFPFVVMTEGVTLEVLGTSFNVRSRKFDMETDVSLVSGKLKVHFPSPMGNHKNIHYLTPGKEILVNRNSWEYEFKPFDVEKVAGWKEGVILLEDAGMKELIDLLERWYGVDIQVFGTPKSPWKINGRYQNEKLEDILIGLQFVYGIDYQINGKNVLIKIKD